MAHKRLSGLRDRYWFVGRLRRKPPSVKGADAGWRVNAYPAYGIVTAFVGRIRRSRHPAKEQMPDGA